MQGSKKFAFDFGFIFISSIVNLLFGFVIMVVLGRHLGAGDLGLFRMAGTIYGIATLFSFIGIPSAIIKFVAESIGDRKKLNLIISAGMITSIILGVVSSLLFYFLSGIFESIFNMPGLSDLLKIYSPIFPFAIMNAVLLGILNGLREMKKFAISLIIQSILLLVISVPLIYWGFGAGGAVIGVVLSSVGMWLNLMWISRVYFKFTFDEYVQITKKMLQFGVKVFAAGSINLINNQIDILLIGFYLTSTDLGYYSVAIGLSSFFWMIPLAVQKNTYPATSLYWHQKDHFALNNMLNKSMKYCTVILVLIGLGLGFFSQEIIILLYHKENFISAVLPLQILLIGTVIRGSTYQPIGGSLTGIGRPGIDMKTIAIITIINITLDIILLPRIGIIGAAIATSVSLTVGSLAGIYFIVKYVHMKIDYRWFLNMLGVVIISIVMFNFGKNAVNPLLLVGSILIGYSIAIFCFFFTKEDKDLFKSLASSIIYRS
jgi:stage V sporulation protein B